MKEFSRRLEFLFTSTRGLVLVAIAMISVATAFFGTLSSPMEGLGIKRWLVENAGLMLEPAQREGRIIILYHSIAMAVVAIEVYMVTAIFPMKAIERLRINVVITVGYMLSFIFGLIFAYFGYNFVYHGLFISGKVLVFYAGCLMLVALFPWQKKYHTQDKDRSRTRGGVDLERVALWLTVLITLLSVVFAAVPGSLFGNGFVAFLAEDIIRDPVKTTLERAIIGHLHIMLTLIAIVLTLILSRWYDFRGALHKWSMPFAIMGALVIALGVFMIIPYQPIAHTIITVGSTPMLMSALLLVIFGFRKLIRTYNEAHGITKPTLLQNLKALTHDSIKFGALWQMVFMNFVVTFLGIFMAVKLDEIIRTWPAREERVALTGHWHVLSGIVASILLLYYADLAGLKGKARQWFGWLIIIGTDLSFAAIAILETKRVYVTEAQQQPLVDGVVLATDIGLGMVLLTLAALMVWRLVDLFNNRGRWTQEIDHPEAKP